jgi:phospholipid transport system transporter-binding protein
MSGVRIEAQGGGLFLLDGELNFDTVPSVWLRSLELFADTADLAVDLGGVTRSDSAGLALLIEWLRFARQQHKPIRFQNLPGQMRALIEVSGLEQVLPLP